MKISTKHIISVLALLFSLASCVDDDLLKNIDIPEGETELNASVTFRSYIPALETRSAGNAIKEIKSLWLAIYEKKEGSNEWTLEEGGKIHITAENHHLTTEITDNSRPDGEAQAESQTARANFRLRHKNGQYKIYAVANYDLSAVNDADIDTPDKLKGLSLTWDEANLQNNAEMFGSFSNDESIEGSADETVIVSPNRTIHSWIRRAASKVTVAFDGSTLKDGVSIYLKAVRIKNIPRSCLLGADNTVYSEDNLIAKGEEVRYTESTSYDANYPALVSKELPCYPRVQKTGDDGTLSWVMDPDAHSETNPNSLFFYENMQGTGPDKRQMDENGDDILDLLYQYKLKSCATYIEVDAYYESTNPERPGCSNITYRFMLGQDIIYDYDAKRNCHYKLTLHFNGFANDPDWRIDYVTRLGVTQPKTVDYRGMYFVPDNVSANQGNNFSADNTITVTSFMFQNDDWYARNPIDFKIEYKDSGSTTFSDTPPAWLEELTPVYDKDGQYNIKINYKNPYLEQNINEDLLNNPHKTGIYDLSTKGGTASMTTANSYVVDAQGTYQFPLVYGNAITNGATNSGAYTCNTWYNPATDACLTNFVNYKNEAILQPYILDDIYGAGAAPAGLTASIVWEDVQGLVENITYSSSAYGGKGGIRFTVGSNIAEGNAVIALKDADGEIMWSWHIWVTSIYLSKEVQITNNARHGSVKFGILPVNLGWCSGGIPVRYYDRHECEVRFTQLISGEGQEGMSQTVKIIQQPHIALPCGNNPYFQWGRKDPFIAAGSDNRTTKPWYDAAGVVQTTAPEMMYPDDASRVLTTQATASLIRNPNKWQNGPRVENTDPTIPGDFRPDDIIFFNLWDNSGPGSGTEVIKTVYDPCPAGYHVSPYYAFSGFTEYGESISGDIAALMYAATMANMMPSSWPGYENYNTNIVEFYTNTTKLISIGFPANGYRDWDDNANVLQYGQGEVWHAEAPFVSWGYKPYVAYHLEFTRQTDDFIRHIYPWNNYYATDGFAVRPTRLLP